jgi:hypothetical protein
MRPEKITLFCFFASYLLAMALEATRLIRSTTINRAAAWLCAAAGFAAQTAYLIVRSRGVDLPPLLASTHDWLLVLSWLTVVFYLTVALVHREIAVGLFLLPLVVWLVGVSQFVSRTPNPDLVSLKSWGMAHAAFLVFGITGVVMAAGASLMYLVQHARLKRGRAEAPGLRLFSLEYLARMNWWCIVVSVPLLTLGMSTGMLLIWLSRNTAQPISIWNFSFLASGLSWLGLVLLFAWLLASRRPSGRIVAWRTLIAGGFVLATLLTLSALDGGVHGSAPTGSRKKILPGAAHVSDLSPTVPGSRLAQSGRVA